MNASVRLQVIVATSSIVVCLCLTGTSLAQPEPTEPVAETERFVFYSRLSMNLHDRLVRSTSPTAENDTACLSGLPEATRTAWDRAVTLYGNALAPPEGRLRNLRNRFELSGFGEDVEGGLGPVPTEMKEALDIGEAAYRECWWARDDEANRQWIGKLVPQLSELGDEVASRLAEAYATPWGPWPIPVDIVPYVSRQGANTAHPNQILISSSNEGNQSRAALEIVFHEASHTIVGPRSGEPSRLLGETAERLGLPVPRGLWHVVLFYTTGEVVRNVIRDRVEEDYVPYLYAAGLFDRVWPEFREPLETWWGVYLNGELTMSAAAEHLLKALSEGGNARP